MTIREADNMKEVYMLQNMGLKDYEIEYIRLMKMKENNKRHWEKLWL